MTPAFLKTPRAGRNKKKGGNVSTVKIARVRLSMHILQDILSGQFVQWVGRSSAPDDMEVLGVEQPPHALGQWFYVFLRSATFKSIPEGAEIPEIPPFTFTRTRRE